MAPAGLSGGDVVARHVDAARPGAGASASGHAPDAQPDRAPGTEAVWEVLDRVPDPEIPVISVTDLGIVRDVAWRGDTLEITVTPTYSGCPATRVIARDIEAALRAVGHDKLRIATRIAPPWTTDWMSARGRARLRDYGIAPPEPGGTPAACPRCGGDRLSRVSQFGSTPCKAHWRCDDCLEPFDYFKCI